MLIIGDSSILSESEQENVFDVISCGNNDVGSLDLLEELIKNLESELFKELNPEATQDGRDQELAINDQNVIFF